MSKVKSYSESKIVPDLENIRSMGVICPESLKEKKNRGYSVIAVCSGPFTYVENYLLQAEAKRIVQGLELAMTALKAEMGIIAIRKTGPFNNTFNNLESLLNGRSDIRIYPVDEIYPDLDIAHEYGLSGDSSMVFDMESLVDICYALESKKPVTRKLLYCMGEVSEPSIISAHLGVSFRELIETCGGAMCGEFVILEGNPLQGNIISDTETPVEKTTRGIIVLPLDHDLVNKFSLPVEFAVKRIKSVCTQCALCTELCPLSAYGLKPHMILREISFGCIGGEKGHEHILNALLCRGCGLCSIICPMDLSPELINRIIQQKFKESGVFPDTEMDYSISISNCRRIPVQTVIKRIDLEEYSRQVRTKCPETYPDQVELMLRQVGRNPVPHVKAGDMVKEGEAVAGGLGEGDAALHASISGRVTLVDENRIIIAG